MMLKAKNMTEGRELSMISYSHKAEGEVVSQVSLTNDDAGRLCASINAQSDCDAIQGVGTLWAQVGCLLIIGDKCFAVRREVMESLAEYMKSGDKRTWACGHDGKVTML